MPQSRFVFPEGLQVGTIVADPPWSLDDKPGTRHFVRRRTHYDRMTSEELFAMGEQISSIIHPDGHLWLWVTNPAIPVACKLVEKWGFEYKTLATWKKSKFGNGWWLRSRTEHIIFAARSKNLRANPGSYSTLIEAPYRGHSRKPDIYKTVEALSPGPYLSLFSHETEQREGWIFMGSHSKPGDAFGQEFMRGENDRNDGVVRGVGGLEIVPGRRYVFLAKEIVQIPVIAVEQKGRKVKIEVMDGENKPTAKKTVSIDSLRPLENVR